jgi:hypothetical protein
MHPRPPALARLARHQVTVASPSALARSDYGVKFDVPLAAGGFAIGDKVGLELNVQLFPAP